MCVPALLHWQEEDAMSDGPATLADLERYGEMTASSLLYLALEAVGVRDVAADHCASHIGKAAGLVTALRGLAPHAARGQVYMPLDVLARHSWTPQQLYEAFQAPAPAPLPTLRDVVFEVATVAHGHMQHAAELVPQVPRAATPALMNAV